MTVLKTWVAIPALAVGCAVIGLVAGQPLHAGLALGGLGAALAAAVRGFAGPSVAAAVAAGATALLGVLAILELPVIDLARAALAGGAAMFTIAELVRPLPPTASPLPAIGAALVAGVLDPSYAALLVIAGVRWVRGPWTRVPGALAAPIGGALLIAIALIAATGLVPELWLVWTDRAVADAAPPLGVLELAGDVLGPVTAFAALVGLGVCMTRGRFAAASIIAVVAGAIAVDLVVGGLGSATPIIAALGAGVGIARLTALVRWPVAQTCVGAVAGFMMVLAPAWTLAIR